MGEPGPVGGFDVRAGLDSDGDGVADTVLTGEHEVLWVYTDLDGDGFADQVLGIGADATIRGDAPLPCLAAEQPCLTADPEPLFDTGWTG